MFLAAIGYGALGFPRHMILAGEIIHVKFAVPVLGADVFYGGVFGLFRYAAVSGRIEPELKDLRVEIVNGRSEVHGVPHAHGNEQNIGKN